MFKKFFITFAIVAALLILYNIYLLATTKNHSPADVAEYSGDSLKITIHYCRPYKKGRLIFGKDEEALVPFGEKWRTGANEATQITLSQDIYLQDSLLKSGVYSLYTIPDQSQWVLAINSKTDYWGRTLVGSPFEERYDVLRVQGNVSKLTPPAEQFTINFAEADGLILLILMWDDTKVSFTINQSKPNN